MRYIIFLLSLIILTFIFMTCSPRGARHFLTMDEVEQVQAKAQEKKKTVSKYAQLRANSNSACNDKLNYVPDAQHLDHNTLRYVRMNFHIMRDSRGKNNFTKSEGVEYVKGWINAANKQLAKNSKMNLPLGNGTPVLPTNYRYVLAADPNIPGDNGVYFHDDDELYYFVKTGKNKNNYVKTPFKKYGIQKGKVLNVFMMPHHPDSVASKTYNPSKTGIAFVKEGAVKIAGPYYLYKNPKMKNGKPFNRGAWFCHDVFNHEVGHVLGLHHTWRSNDGCDDTPKNANCYSQDKRKKDCIDGWSNNVMDYNVHQNSWTPCQIGIVQRNFAKKGSSQRGLIVPTWCKLNPEKNIYIKRDVVWNGAKDLEGNLTIDKGGKLTIGCRVSIPKNGRIVVKSGATLVLDGATLENDCGDEWQGILVEGSGNNKGKVIFMNDPTLTNMKNPLG